MSELLQFLRIAIKHCGNSAALPLLVIALIVTSPTASVYSADAEPTETRALTLAECYAMAAERSEKLMISSLDIKLADARYREAMSSLFPKLSFDSTYQIRDNDNFGRIVRQDSTNEDPSGSTGGSGGSLGTTQLETALSLTQPLFHGFRDLLIANAEKTESSALRHDLARAREILFQDIATLYHQILLTASDLAIYARAERTLLDRIKELERLRGLGQARDGEVVAAQSDLAELNANKEIIIGTRDSSKELLAFLIGLNADSLSLRDEVEPVATRPLDEYLLRARARSDLKAQQLRSEAQTSRLEAARRASWPTLDAVGNAYAYEDPDRSRDWEARLLVSLPIFDGGRISSQTAQEALKAQSIRAKTAETERLIERDVRVAFSKVQASLREVQSLKKHRDAAQRNSNFQQKDYALGVVSNLDVLQAIRSLQDAELQLARAESQAKINKVELEVAAGGVTP